MALASAVASPLFTKNSIALMSDSVSNPFLKNQQEEANWKKIRDHFPLSHERVYFNNGTLGPSPTPVLNSVIEAMRELERTGEYKENDADVARGKLAAFVGATKDEISLTHNTTEGINIIAWGAPLKKGDEVIMTTHEHVGGALPWLNRAKVDGIVIRAFEPAPTAEGNLEKISALINPRTKMLAIPHISCTTGQVFPVKEISKLGHKKGLLVAFDGAHATGMLPLDLHDMDCDFYASCGHKWLCGPKGTAFVYIRKSLLDTLQAKFVGAYSDIHWTLTPQLAEITGYVPTAHRYDYGSQNTALFTGLGAAVDFFNQIGPEKIYSHGKELSQLLYSELKKRDQKIQLLTPEEERSRAMMTGFKFKHLSMDNFVKFAGVKGFRVRQVKESGLDSVRISTHLYNTVTEVENFVEMIDLFS